MTRRVLRLVGLAVLWVLALRGALALLKDFPVWSATEELRYVTHGARWTAFERCIDYRFIADRDTVLYLARAIDDRSTWTCIAPTDTHLMGPMEWLSPTRLRIPASFRVGCFKGLDDVSIQWDGQ